MWDGFRDQTNPSRHHPSRRSRVWKSEDDLALPKTQGQLLHQAQEKGQTQDNQEESSPILLVRIRERDVQSCHSYKP